MVGEAPSWMANSSSVKRAPVNTMWLRTVMTVTTRMERIGPVERISAACLPRPCAARRRVANCREACAIASG